jgi:hypothetical protein
MNRNPARRALTALGMVAVVALVAPVAPAAAQACDPVEAGTRDAAIRRHLDQQAHRAKIWDLAWGIGLSAAAAGQIGLVAAEWHPLEDYNDDVEAALYVGAGKSIVSAAAHVVLPLKIVKPPAASGDACADVTAAERALAETAGNQRTAFFVNHAGSVAFAVGGLLILGLGFDTWSEGWKSAAVSYPLGLAITYTLPRASWKAVRSGRFAAPAAPASPVSLGMAPMHGLGVTGLAVTGRF